MKNHIRSLVAVALCSGLIPLHAQFGPRSGMGGPPGGPKFSGSTAKIFGEHSAFSAMLEVQSKDSPAGNPVTMPGKLAYLGGKSRFEMDLSQMKGGKMPPDAIAAMKQMGMDKTVMISRPDKKVAYIVYPGLQAFAETPLSDPDAAKSESDFSIETSELGKESVDGHDCIKNKAVVTDKEGKKHESTVWNATNLKKFPIKIETPERDGSTVMLFKDVKLANPEATLFDPPSGFTKYDSVQAMMQQEMLKRLGGAGVPPARP